MWQLSSYGPRGLQTEWLMQQQGLRALRDVIAVDYILGDFKSLKEVTKVSNTCKHINCMLCLYGIARQACVGLVDHAIMHSGNSCVWYLSVDFLASGMGMGSANHLLTASECQAKMVSQISSRDVGLVSGMKSLLCNQDQCLAIQSAHLLMPELPAFNAL